MVRAFGCVLVLRSVLFGDLVVRIQVFGCFRLFGYEASGALDVGSKGSGIWLFPCASFLSLRALVARIRALGRQDLGIWLPGSGA